MKYLITLSLLIFANTAYGLEPNFSLVGTTKAPTVTMVRATVDLPDVWMPTFVGSGNDIGKPPVPTEDLPTSPKPQGEGWQWSKQEKNWWRYVPQNEARTYSLPTYSSPFVSGGCPTGNCPNSR